MADEWSVSALDLDAYLARISYTGPVSPSQETLAALHRAHLGAIPFENLDVILGRGVRVDLPSIQDKLVHGRRGGYCYEHGQLFGAALERLGFSVERLLARVGPEDTRMPPRTHLTLRVRVGLDVWLADVGFGSSPPGPLSLRRFRSGGPQDLGGWVYEVAPDEGGAVWKLRELQGDEWVTLYRYEDQRVYPVDVVLSNHYTSTHPDSWFTHAPVLALRSPGEIRSLVGRAYTVTRPGHVKERRVLSDAEFAAALGEVFGLSFTTAEAGQLTASADGI